MSWANGNYSGYKMSCNNIQPNGLIFQRETNNSGISISNPKKGFSFASSKPTLVNCSLFDKSTKRRFNLMMDGPSTGRVNSNDPSEIKETLFAVKVYNSHNPECPLSIRG